MIKAFNFQTIESILKPENKVARLHAIFISRLLSLF